MFDPAARPRALLVDDDRGVRSFLAEVLDALGWDVVAEDCGSRVLEAARAARPDLLILDLLMPGLDGYSVLARLKQEAGLADVPIVLISGEPAQVHEQIGRDLGAAGFLEKPFDLFELRRTIESFDPRIAR